MIEIAMYVALGFLVASLLALLMSRPLWRRAVRLTTMRLESTLPMSRADMEAGKDELRAQYAIKLRNFELALEKEKAKSTRYLVDRNKSRAAAQSLNRTVAELKAALAEHENQINVLKQNVQHFNGTATVPPSAAAAQIEATREAPAGVPKAADSASRADAIQRQPAPSEPGAIAPLQAENARLESEAERLRQELAELRGSTARDWDLLKTEVTDLAEQILRGDTESSPPARAPAKPRVPKVPKATITRPLPTAKPKKQAPRTSVAPEPEAPAEAEPRGKLRSRLGSLAQRLEALTESNRS